MCQLSESKTNAGVHPVRGFFERAISSPAAARTDNVHSTQAGLARRAPV